MQRSVNRSSDPTYRMFNARRRGATVAARLLAAFEAPTSQCSTIPLSNPRYFHSLESARSRHTIVGRNYHVSPSLRLDHLFARGFASFPPHTELAMPALSPTMSQGNIVSWKKKEGDSIQPGDIYCEVETDKATIEWEAQEEGFLAKILVPEGTKDIAVGRPVAIIVEEESELAAFADYSPVSVPEKKQAEKPAPKKKSAPAKAAQSFPPHTVLSMPALSPTMSQGNIIGWKKAEGDEVAAGDVFGEVETDKATIDWESQEDGFIAKILVPEGSKDIKVGEPVLVLVEDKDALSAFENFTAADAGGAGGAQMEEAPEPAKEAAQSKPNAGAPKKAATLSPTTRVVASGDRVKASPYAKKLAHEAGVSLSGVGGSGPGGRIVAADVEHLLASGGGRAAVGGMPSDTLYSHYTDVPNSQIRKVTARRLLESKQQVPHYYLTISARVDTLLSVRKALNESLAASNGAKLSVNDFIVKAAALACKKVPEVNASWQGDFIRRYHNVDCSIAVQTPVGLMVPIVKNADVKGLAQLSSEIKELANKAKEGKLKPEEYSGGTFTISNLGMFGVNQFAAIINPPQAAILAVGGSSQKVVPSNSGFEGATFIQCTLSCDHRVVDGAVGAQWLAVFRRFLENPAEMLL